MWSKVFQFVWGLRQVTNKFTISKSLGEFSHDWAICVDNKIVVIGKGFQFFFLYDIDKDGWYQQLTVWYFDRFKFWLLY